MFVEPGEDVYEGMIVGENSRSGGPRRQRRQGEAPDQRALLHLRRAGAARAGAQALARPGARVRPRGRMRRGDTAFRANAQGQTRGGRACARSSTSQSVDLPAYTSAPTGTDAQRPPKFEDLLDAAPDAMVGVDAAGVAVFANDKAKALLGRDPVGEPLGELPPALDVLALLDGRRVRARRAARRRPAGAARRAREHARRRSSSRTPTGATSSSTAAFERLHGKPATELIGRLDREVLAPEIADRMRVDDLRVMAEREPIELQEEVTHGEQTRTFLAVKFPLIDEQRRALRRRRRRDRHHPPRPAGGAAARGAAAGGGRPARRRRRARLQQPARGDRQLRRVRAQGAATTRAAPRATWTRSSRPRGAPPSSRAGCCCSRAASPARPRCSRCGA